MTELLDRVRGMAETQRDKDAARNRKRFWHVTYPGKQTLQVLVSPECDQAEMLVRYPGCGILPMSEDEVREWQR